MHVRYHMALFLIDNDGLRFRILRRYIPLKPEGMTNLIHVDYLDGHCKATWARKELVACILIMHSKFFLSSLFVQDSSQFVKVCVLLAWQCP